MTNTDICEHCGEALGSVAVTTLEGVRLHPDCYDKWRRELIAEHTMAPHPKAWGVKRGEA